MAFCKNCGNEIDDKAVICPDCGVAQKNLNDNGGIGWGLLGCCLPLVGLILFLVWKGEKPNTAKSLIIGAGIGFALIVLSNIIMAVFGVSLAEAGMYY